MVKLISRYFIAALAGAALALSATAVVLYSLFAAGGYTREALVEPPAWAFAAIGVGGAIAGLAVAACSTRRPLPWAVRGAALGALAGVGVVASVTLAAAWSLGGASSIGQGPYLEAGLRYGMPAGLVLGAVLGLVVGRPTRVGAPTPEDER